jgi:ATP-dependent Lhr-like helicase
MSATLGLDPRVLDCIRKRGFTALSDVQEQAIPAVLDGANLLLIAPTGTGKTESAMLPVFNRMLSCPQAGFSTVYITPLRSLNRDILSRMEWWCRELDMTVGVRHGDTPLSERRKQALNPPQLLITTPETLQALFMGKRLRSHLKQVRCVVVDEIHDLAGTKRGAQLAVALERLTAYAGDFQRIGLSATVGNPEEVARFLAGKRPCSVVNVPVAKQLDISVSCVGDDFSRQARTVEKIIEDHASVLIFTNTRVTAEALGHQLFRRGDIEVHHGSLSRDVRIEAEERFKRGEVRALICTSSMELGIDIGHVEYVIQFGSPREVSRLVQRVGRAGHQLNTVSSGTILAAGFDDLVESLVITRRAREGAVEAVVPHRGAADVLANQIAAMAVEYGEIQLKRMEDIISASSVFSQECSLIPEVSRQMEQHRLVRVRDDSVITTARARRYLASTLSMIHDERKLPVFDMISRRTVGTLDESFVVGFIHTGVVFITKGQLWRVLDIEDGRITVEPARHAKGELPSWEGEQIPVPYEVAQEAGRLRRTRDIRSYTCDPESMAFFGRFLDEMDRNRSIVPTDTEITLEYTDEGVVMNVCGGHKANEALGRVVSVLLSARFGTTVGIEIDAYRVFFRLPSTVGAVDVKEILDSLHPTHLQGILELALKRTSLFRWKLVQIAKKFGAIDPDADYERLSLHKLSELFEMTVVQREAYRELFSCYMDVECASTIVGKIRDGGIRVTMQKISLIGAAGLFSSRDQIPPPTADQAVLNAVRQRLENDHVILACMNCREWRSKTQVSRVPDPPRCPKCGARLVAALKPYEEHLFDLASKKKKTEEERNLELRLLRNANIVLSSGKKAVTALAARGVGPENASRILATLTEGDAFYREIIKAERNFIRTHKFWQ